MVEFKKLVTTLPSGTNSHTFTDALINDDSVIEVYTNDDDVYPINTTQSGNSVSIELSTHSDDVELCITINNVEEYSPVDISGLEDEIEGLSDIVNDISDNINNIEGDISTLGGMVTDLETSKQDTLTPGENISIVNNVISASGGGGSDFTLDLLWENHNKNNAFGAQSLTIPGLNNYKVLLLYYKSYKSNTGMFSTAFTYINGSTVVFHALNLTNGVIPELVQRSLILYTGSIYVGEGATQKTNSTNRTVNNDINVPIYIYGIRG